MIEHFNIICENLLRTEPADAAEIMLLPYVKGLTDLRRVEYYYQLIKRAQRKKNVFKNDGSGNEKEKRKVKNNGDRKGKVNN